MVSSTQREYVLYLNIPVVIQLVPIATAVFYLVLPLYLLWMDGFAQSRGFWLLEAAFFPGVVFMLWLAFPRQHTKAHLNVKHDSIAFTPRRSDRRFLGEQTVQIPVTPNSKEILLCGSVYEGMPDGYRLIVRDNDRLERELRVKFWTSLDAQDCRIITEGIIAATGLPVRLVIRRRSANKVEETDWLPPERGQPTAKGFAFAAIAALPFAGGIITAYLRPQAAVSITVGFLLWLLQLGAGATWTRWSHSQTHRSWLESLTTVFAFGAAYGVAFVLVAFVLRAG